MSLTPKQEAFAQFYVELGNASEAYRRAYDAENSSLPVVWKEASLLLDNPKVSVRVSELQASHLAESDVSARDIVRVAWEIAKDDAQQASSRVSALSLLAKRHPEFSEKHDHNVNTRSQALVAIASMTDEQLEALIQGAQAANNSSALPKRDSAQDIES